MNMEQAVDDILDLFKAAWDATGHEVLYEQTRDQRDTSTSPWAVVLVRHEDGFQDTLGGQGNSSFIRLGSIQVDIHIPSATGLPVGYQLAKVVADAYEGVTSPNGVWFRRVRVNEMGRDGSFFILKVLANFEYYETK